MTGNFLLMIAIVAPGIGSLVALFLWTLVQIGRGIAALTPDLLARPLAPLTSALATYFPPPGRTSRAASWFFLFTTLLALLLLPAFPSPWSPGSSDSLFGFLGLDPVRWLLALIVAINSLCAAVAAWEPDSPPLLWVCMLVIEFLTLLALCAVPLWLTLLALDLACLTFGVSLTLHWRDNLPFAGQTLLRTLRHWLVISLLAGGFGWAGFRLSLSTDWVASSALLLALGFICRAGLFPLHGPATRLHEHLTPPAAMLLTGALLPVASYFLLPYIPTLGGWFDTLLFIGALLAWSTGTRETDLRRAVSHWTVAALATTLLIHRSAPQTELYPVAATLMLVALATGSTMATFLAGAIEADLGHADISRLRGLAARAPAGLNWMLVAGLILAGAPPFASFTAHLLIGTVPNHSLSLIPGALLWIIAIGSVLMVLGHTYLGIPRTQHENPIDMTPRQRLVLLLLLTACVVGTLAPATLFKPPVVLPTP